MKRWGGFLTKEERLVVLTLSVCLTAGGLFRLANSVFELPDAVRPPDQDVSVVNKDEIVESGLTMDETQKSGDEAGSGLTGVDGQLSPVVGPASQTGTPGLGHGSAHGIPRDRKTQRLSAKLDLNRATAAELEALPGIGPALAARIIEQRRNSGGFRSVDELLTVHGIGKKTLGRFRQWVYVSPRE